MGGREPVGAAGMMAVFANCPRPRPLATFTQPTIAGPPTYRAPEALRGRSMRLVDGRSQHRRRRFRAPGGPRRGPLKRYRFTGTSAMRALCWRRRRAMSTAATQFQKTAIAGSRVIRQGGAQFFVYKTEGALSLTIAPGRAAVSSSMMRARLPLARFPTARRARARAP